MNMSFKKVLGWLLVVGWWLVAAPVWADWGNVGNAGFSVGQAGYTSLAFASDGTPYVAYKDGSTSGKATVMKFNSSSSSWETVGNAGFSVGTASYTSLAFASDDTPYVAYQDGGNSNKATVMKFNSSSSSWETVGSAGFSAGGADYTSLAFASDDTPYVAYKDAANSNKTTVMKFNSSSSSWETVGSAGFSAGGAYYTNLVFASDDTPYVAYRDGSTSGKATVMKFNSSSSSWETVGSAGFSADNSWFNSLAFASDDTPYVAYMDGSTSDKATVMKFNSSSSSWETVGSAGFSAGGANDTSLAFASDDTPYVAYKDAANSNKTTVMKFNSSSSSWETVGSAGFSAGTANYTSLAFASDGTPYVAYQDGGNGYKATVMKFVPPLTTSSIEDAEDGDVSNWTAKSITGSPAAAISVTTDNSDNVLSLTGEAEHLHHFSLTIDPANTTQFWASWRLKFNEVRYAVAWEVTNDSAESHLLLYLGDGIQACQSVPGYIHCGLDSNTHDGNWWTIARDLAADLTTAGQGTIASVDALHFWTLGNGLFDDLVLGANAPDGWTDTDSDGIADTADLDDDNDGILDANDSNPTTYDDNNGIFENGDNGTANWWIMDNTPAGANVAVVDDSGNNVIELQGAGMLNAFELRRADGGYLGSTDFLASLDVRFDEPFVLEIGVQTDGGWRILRWDYRVAEGDCSLDANYIECNMDSSVFDGTWKTLSGDLGAFVSSVSGGSLTLEKVQTIRIRGAGQVDDVSLLAPST